jgi:hypothetical protein
VIKPKRNNQIFYEGIKNLLDKDINILDAVTLYCERNNIDIEVAGSWIKSSSELKEIFEGYAVNNYLIKKNISEGVSK